MAGRQFALTVMPFTDPVAGACYPNADDNVKGVRMQHFMQRFLDALYESRKRQADLFIRRYSHVIADVRMPERRREFGVSLALSAPPDADQFASGGMEFNQRAAS
jgi:hypothetical protein